MPSVRYGAEEMIAGSRAITSLLTSSVVLVDTYRFRSERPCSEARGPPQPAGPSPDASARDPAAVAGELAPPSQQGPWALASWLQGMQAQVWKKGGPLGLFSGC